MTPDLTAAERELAEQVKTYSDDSLRQCMRGEIIRYPDDHLAKCVGYLHELARRERERNKDAQSSQG